MYAEVYVRRSGVSLIVLLRERRNPTHDVYGRGVLCCVQGRCSVLSLLHSILYVCDCVSPLIQHSDPLMATRHTGGEALEDSDTDRSEQSDRTERGSEKGKRSVTQKILHSKAMQRMAGKKLGADVTPVKELQPPLAHVQVVVTTAKKTSDTIQQPPKHSQEQMLFQYTDPPLPGRQHHRSDHRWSDPHAQSPGATQQRRPDTSPQQAHATAGTVLREQPRYPDQLQPPLQSMCYDHLQQVI